MKTATTPRELVIFVPHEPPDTEIYRIKEKLGKEIKLRFKIDPTLIGGAALAYNGRYKDYSLKARFQEKDNQLKEIYELSLRGT